MNNVGEKSAMSNDELVVVVVSSDADNQRSCTWSRPDIILSVIHLAQEAKVLFRLSPSVHSICFAEIKVYIHIDDGRRLSLARKHPS